jgi:hypothetical protein
VGLDLNERDSEFIDFSEREDCTSEEKVKRE